MNADIEVSVSGEHMYAKGITEQGKAILADLFFTEDVNEGYPFGVYALPQFKQTFDNLGYPVAVVS